MSQAAAVEEKEGEAPSRAPAPIPTKEQRRDLEAARATLEVWMAARMPEKTGFRLTDARMPGGAGVANETLIVDAAWEEGGETREGGYVVRAETVDGLFTCRDFANQYRCCEALAGIDGLPVATVIGLEEDRSVLGDKFYVMEKLPGQSCPDNPPFHSSGWVTEMTTAQRAHMWRQGVGAVAKVNDVPLERVRFLDRPRRGKTGWEQEFDYYCDFRDWAIFGEENPVIDGALDWLWKNKPDDTPTEMSWGDARFSNLMYDGTGDLTGVLDWDMVSLAGGETDIAWWIVAHFNATHASGIPKLPGIGTARETMALWEQCSGRKLTHFDYHLVFAAFRNAIVVVRLGKQLQRAGLLSPEGEFIITNNRGIQYLTTMLDLKPQGPITMPWPSLDV